jgi:hypothetical protein
MRQGFGIFYLLQLYICISVVFLYNHHVESAVACPLLEISISSETSWSNESSICSYSLDSPSCLYLRALWECKAPAVLIVSFELFEFWESPGKPYYRWNCYFYEFSFEGPLSSLFLCTDRKHKMTTILGHVLKYKTIKSIKCFSYNY